MIFKFSDKLFVQFSFVNGIMIGFEYEGSYDILLVDLLFVRFLVFFNGIGVEEEE